MKVRWIAIMVISTAICFLAPACPQECETNRDCGVSAYCAYEVGVCEGPGVCEERPDACTDIYDPVCGCDGKTYGNACEAAASGVSILHEGECDIRE